MKQLLFFGYYGHQNTGDDAFIEVSAWGAKKYWNNYRIKFLTQNMPVIQNIAEYTGKSYFRGHDILKATNAIMAANSFICAGGSTFHSRIHTTNPKNIARFKKKHFPGFKFGAIGVSLGPYRSTLAENENIELLKCFDFLALRDKFSYQMALTYNLPYEPIESFDLAALLPEIYTDLPPLKIINSKNVLGISVCNYERYLQNGDLKNEKRRNEKIEKLLTKIAKLNDEIKFRFFIFNGNPSLGDAKLTLAIANKIKSIRPSNVDIVQYNPNIYNTWSKIKECALVLSVRLHFAVFACFADVPFFLVEYHRKCSDFLQDVGYNEDYRIYDANFDAEEVAIKLIEIMQGRQPYLKPSEINLAIEKARLNFTKINYYVK